MKNVKVEGFKTNTGVKDKILESFCDFTHENTRTNIPQFELGDWPTFNKQKWTENSVAVVGTLRGTETIIWESQRRGHNFYYMDHAYFHATRLYQGDIQYRIIKSQMQLNHLVDLDEEDYKRIDRYKPITTKSFVKNGNHILLCPPTKAICRLYNLGDEQSWINDMVSELKSHTDRDIIIRKKDETKTLQEQLKNCHAIVTHQSTAAIQAILQGVPSFCDLISQSVPVSEIDISKIETPFYPDDDLRQQWIDSLLSCQFNMSEISNGKAREIVDRLQ